MLNFYITKDSMNKILKYITDGKKTHVICIPKKVFKSKI